VHTRPLAQFAFALATSIALAACDAQHKKVLGAARKAWTTYRDAEIAL